MSDSIDPESICERCTSNLKPSEFTLCTHCKLKIGDKPSDDFIVCEYCGGEWIHKSLIMCMSCLETEPSLGEC